MHIVSSEYPFTV
ncbi:hypothetical protein VCHENC02_3957, partial [Vibrio harveyi]